MYPFQKNPKFTLMKVGEWIRERLRRKLDGQVNQEIQAFIWEEIERILTNELPCFYLLDELWIIVNEKTRVVTHVSHRCQQEWKLVAGKPVAQYLPVINQIIDYRLFKVPFLLKVHYLPLSYSHVVAQQLMDKEDSIFIRFSPSTVPLSDRLICYYHKRTGVIVSYVTDVPEWKHWAKAKKIEELSFVNPLLNNRQEDEVFFVSPYYVRLHHQQLTDEIWKLEVIIQEPSPVRELRKILDWQPSAIVLTDTSGNVSYRNYLAKRFFSKDDNLFNYINSDQFNLFLTGAKKNVLIHDGKCVLERVQPISGGYYWEFGVSEQLQKWQQIFQVFENTPVLVSVLDQSMRFQVVASAVAKILRIPPQYLIGQHALDRVHPDDHEIVLEKFSQLLQKEDGDFEAVMIRYLDGQNQYRYLQVYGIRQLENPLIQGVVVVALDITHLYQTHLSLQEKAFQLHAIAHSIPESFLLLNQELEVLYVSNNVYSLLGYYPEQFKGKSFFTLLEKWLTSPEIEYLQRVLRENSGNNLIQYEFKIEEKILELRFHPIFQNIYPKYRYVCVISDITHATQLREALENSFRFLKLIIESLQDPFFAIDQHHHIVFLNQEASRLLKTVNPKIQEFKKESIWNIWPELLNTPFYHMVRNVFRSRNKAELTIFFPSLKRWYTITFYPLEEGIVAISFRNVTEEKLLEERLREREQLYRVTVETQADLICHLGLNGEILFTNEAFRRFFGSDLLASKKNLWEILQEFHCAPDDVTQLKEALNTLNEHKTRITQVLLRFYLKEQETFYTYWDILLLTHQSKPLFLLVGHDLTVEMAAKEALAKTNEELLAIFQSLPDIFLRIKRDGKILEKQRGRYFEGSLWNFVEQVEDFDSCLPEEYQIKASRLRETCHQPCVFQFTLPFQGQVEYYEARFTPFVKDELLVFIRNVTMQKRVEEEIAFRTRLYQSVVENLQEVFFQIDHTHSWRFLNQAWETLSGYTVEQTLGEPIYHYFAPEDTRLLKANIQEVLRQAGRCSRFETRLLTKQGTYKEVSIFMRNVQLSSNETLLLGSIVDISERKHIERELILAKEKAEKVAQVKSEFLATMSHEIRTPLNGIIGCASILKTIALNQEQTNLVDMILNSSKTLLEIIQDILDYSKIEANRMEIKYEMVDLKELLENFIATFITSIYSKSLEFYLYIDPHLPKYIKTDASKIQTILLNLIGNSIKFTQNGYILVSISMVNEDLLIRVKDTGIGIEQKILTTIFDPFTQGDSSLHRRYPGTGLGLAITKKIVDLLQGHINVYSIPGKGTSFSISIPLQGVLEEKLSPFPSLKKFSLYILMENRKAAFLIRKQIEPYFASIHQISLKDLSSFQFPPNSICLLENSIWNDFKKYYDHWDGILCYYYSPFEEIPDFPSSILPIAKPFRTNFFLRQIQNFITKGIHSAPQLSTDPSSIVDFSEEFPLRILLAEDHPTNRFVMEKIFSRIGYSVDIAQNGYEALKKIRKQNYDLFLLDIHMADLDGFELLRRLDEAGIPRPKFICAFTADVTPRTEEQAKRMGIHYFLTKPVNLKKVYELLWFLYQGYKNVEKNIQ